MEEMELVVEYRSKINGLKYVRFGAEEEAEDTVVLGRPYGSIDLFCSDDSSGNSDIHHLTNKELEENYEEIKRYWQEA